MTYSWIFYVFYSMIVYDAVMRQKFSGELYDNATYDPRRRTELLFIGVAANTVDRPTVITV